jgi:hypothetical protein
MAKFLNKKEQVLDLKLTSYGHYLLSVGAFVPKYYAFYDDNIIYDQKYAHSGAFENQNDIDKRITEETVYIESLVLFRDTEETLNQNDSAGVDWYNQAQILARKRDPAKDTFKYEMALGDAYLDGDTKQVPSWKIYMLQSDIASSTTINPVTNERIPQVNISASYIKRTKDNSFDYDPMNLREMDSKTTPFIDNRVVSIESKDPVIYIEELNTQPLVQNYDIEIFQVLTSSISGSIQTLTRKYFRKDIPQVQNGFLMSEVPKERPSDELTTGSVEYYFDVLTDRRIDQKIACKGANQFAKQSYYIDLGFDCDTKQKTTDFFDIYGAATEPEICQ